MTSANVAALRQHLSRYLRMVKAGESVVVIDRHEPVAVITAIAPGTSADESVRRLVSQGIARNGGCRPVREILHALPPGTSMPRASQSLIAERRHGR